MKIVPKNDRAVAYSRHDRQQDSNESAFMKMTLWKSLLLGLLLINLAAGIACGQNNFVSFTNLDPVHGVNAPFFDGDGTNRLAGDTYVAALYFGLPGTPPENFLLAGPPRPFRTGNFAGYWVAANILIPFVQPTGTFLAQVRFWDTKGGVIVTFEQAVATLAKVGFSSVLPLTLSASGTPLTGLQRTGLIPVVALLSPGESRLFMEAMAVPNGLQLESLSGRPVGLRRWFHLTCARPGEVVIAAESATIDPVLSVFTHCLLSANQCVLVGYNDNRGPGQTASEVRFRAETNVTYAVAVSGVNGATGAVQIAFSLPGALAISPIEDQSVTENTSTGPIPFTIGGTGIDASTVTVTGVSSNPSLVPVGNLVFGGSGSNRLITVTPAPNQFGAATITVVAHAPSGDTANSSFQVTVNAMMNIARANDLVRVSWTATNGRLQYCGEMNGHWEDIQPEPTSPYSVPPTATGFYRLRQR